MTSNRPKNYNSRKKRQRMAKQKRERQVRRQIAFIILLIISAVFIIVMLALLRTSPSVENTDVKETKSVSNLSAVTYEEESGADETGYVSTDVFSSGSDAGPVMSTARIGVTGDILLHDSVLLGACQYDGSYDFSGSFAKIASYWSEMDYMIANLEVPLSGGSEFSGYPVFNAPDSIAANLKDAGVDMCLTATNHACDAGLEGLLHTQTVLSDTGLDYVGTRALQNQDYVLTKDLNGIKFGFACYTYCTALDDASEDLVNSFYYDDLDSLLDSVADNLEKMSEENCDVTVFFMHWGEEYQDYPDSYQTQIAQEMCDLGVDLIIGTHPHVIQSFDILKGCEGNTTYCFYSIGNALSGQNKEKMNEDDYRGYTEDGVVIEFTFEKLGDGSVSLLNIYALPTWVENEDGVFTIVPLDFNIETALWPALSISDALDSYYRTEERLGSVYTELESSMNISA